MSLTATQTQDTFTEKNQTIPHEQAEETQRKTPLQQEHLLQLIINFMSFS